MSGTHEKEDMTMQPYASERTHAIQAVLTACQLCSAVQHRLTTDHKISKSDASPVTVADFGSQALIISHLLRTFPSDPVVSEEEASVLRRDDHRAVKENVLKLVRDVMPDLSETQILDAIDYGARSCDCTRRYWTLDPIDGTKGFLRGDQYAVALALVENGHPVLGVLGCPNLAVEEGHPAKGKGCLFVAVTHQGAWMRPIDNPEETQISGDPVTQPQDARFCESVEAAHSSHSTHGKIAQELGMTKPPYRIDSQCKYAAVARGDASMYLRLTKKGYQSWIWDHAAGSIVVQEAGGKVTDVHGKPLDFSVGRKLSKNSGVIVTNGHVHEAVLEAVRHVTE